jgi:hypothetical protein
VERYRLAIDAHARGDLDEVRRLSDTCPEEKYFSQDPAYTERMKASLVIAPWAANFLQRARMGLEQPMAAKEFAAELHDLLAAEVSEAVANEVTADKSAIDRVYLQRASEMVGVCEGIQRFCEALGVPPENLLSFDRSCLPLWALGCELAETHPCDETVERAVYDQLTACWSAFVPVDSGPAEASADRGQG